MKTITTLCILLACSLAQSQTFHEAAPLIDHMQQVNENWQKDWVGQEVIAFSSPEARNQRHLIEAHRLLSQNANSTSESR
ncbi:MAG: hypothetical protein WEC59_11235, partial [Salibacteraceae bacterium]